MASVPQEASNSPRSSRCHATLSSQSVRGTFSVSVGQYRVAAPPARPLPLINVVNEISHPVRQAFGLAIEDKAHQLLEYYNIDYEEYLTKDSWVSDVCVVDRHVERFPETKQSTLLITARWTEISRETWPRIVIELKKFVDGLTNNPTWRETDIAIEMLAPELQMTKYMAPVIGNRALEADWPCLSLKVLSILEYFPQTRGHMTCIALFHFGYHQRAEMNPPTVYISLAYTCAEHTWSPVIEAIQYELDKEPFKLIAFIEHGEGQKSPFPLTSKKSPDDSPWTEAKNRNPALRDSYSAKAQIGSDIGASLYFTRDDGEVVEPLTGTLGCYLELHMADETGWRKMALTDYHTVRPAFDGMRMKAAAFGSLLSGTEIEVAPESMLARLDREGFDPDKSPRENGHRIEHPTRPRIDFQVREGQSEIVAISQTLERRPDIEHLAAYFSQAMRLLQQRQSFLDNSSHELGTPWAGSGLLARTSDALVTDQRRLDWALIEVNPDRCGDNMLPTFRYWMERPDPVPAKWIPFRAVESPLRQPTADSSLNNLNPGDAAYKMGALTGATCGLYLGYRPILRLKDDEYLGMPPSREHVFVGHEGSEGFAKPGDSGAVVFDQLGRVVGLVFAGLVPQQVWSDNGLVIVTPIEDVFDDIKRSSGGKIKDIRIAQCEARRTGSP